MALRAGFIGLGNIGKPMAKRLVAAGFETTVHDLVPAPVHELVVAGAKAIASPRAIGVASDYVGLCVRDDTDLRAVSLGPEGLFAGTEPGTIVAIHSTVQPKTILELAEVAAARGIGVVDACVTGGAAGAAQGTLTVMVGGDVNHLDKIRPALESFSKLIVHAGPLGAGAKLKLCNNLMTYLAWTSAYEATLLARAAGLPQKVLEDVTRANGNLTEPMLAFLALHKTPVETRQGEGFQAMVARFVELAEKDLASTLALARECGVALPGAGLASQIMARVYGLEDPKRR